MKREGPPQLQFLTATDPSQFKDEDAKRSVRSQAMIHWRHEESKKIKRGSYKDGAEPAPAPPERRASIPTRSKRQDSGRSGSEPSGYRKVRAESSSLELDSDAKTFTDAGSSSWQLTAGDTASYFPRWQNKIRAVAERNVIQYEASERHEERQLRSLVVGLASFHSIGSTHDPFDVLPQFRNPRLDALYLSRNCKSSDAASRNRSDPFRYASIRLRRDDEKVAATDAVTSPYHLKLHCVGINVAGHAEQSLWRQYHNGYGQDRNHWND